MLGSLVTDDGCSLDAQLLFPSLLLLLSDVLLRAHLFLEVVQVDPAIVFDSLSEVLHNRLFLYIVNFHAEVVLAHVAHGMVVLAIDEALEELILGPLLDLVLVRDVAPFYEIYFSLFDLFLELLLELDLATCG